MTTRFAALSMLWNMPDYEPVFVLRVQDQAAIVAIQAWIDEARRIGASEDKCDSAKEDLHVFMDWQKTLEQRCQIKI